MGTRVNSMIQFVSNVRPSSNEKDCSQRAEECVMSFHPFEAHLGRPPAEEIVTLEATFAVLEATDKRRVKVTTPDR